MMRQPAIYIPHGGGPCFFMDPPAEDPSRWVAMEAYLRGVPARLPQRPDFLLVISAHWEMPRPTLLASAKPGLLFDYYNFPPHTYRLTYPAPGAPELGVRVRSLLGAADIDSGEDHERGYDHGIFVPLKVMFPDADIPILQLSMQAGLDPVRHLEIGRALSPLRAENVLIVGSGLSFHNLRSLGDPGAAGPSEVFDEWLTQVLCRGAITDRERQLARWDQAPGARICHPREEHLLPLMVAAGAGAGDAGQHTFSGKIWGKSVSAYHFG
jgi:aromatic ring-opening dioxygenase catalytic subunit (LigB family)